MLVKLRSVTSREGNYSSVANKCLFDIFKLKYVSIGDRSIFEKVNSKDMLYTSEVKKITFDGNVLSVVTENSEYIFNIV